MTTLVLAHGAWSSAWAWRKMRSLLHAAGHDLVAPSLTGLGARHHMAGLRIDLEHHVRDVLGVLEMEDLRDVVLTAIPMGAWWRPAARTARAIGSSGSCISTHSRPMMASRRSI